MVGFPNSVSVIIPIYGRPRLTVVLNSLCRQSLVTLIQQVIIVDDGTPVPKRLDYNAIVKQFPELPIEVLCLDVNRGPAAARNAGVAMARGEIIFFTDDDCEVPANWIETHLRQYEKFPHISAVGGWYSEPLRQPMSVYRKVMFTRDLGMLNYIGQDLFRFYATTADWPSLHVFPACNTANLSLRRPVFGAVRGFNERFVTVGGEDFDLMHRIRSAGYVLLYIPQFVIHHKSYTLRSFIKLGLNRAGGMYMARRQRRESVVDWKRIFITRLQIYSQSDHYRSLNWWQKKSFALHSALFMFLMHSNISIFFMGFVCRRRIKKYKLS